MVSGLAGSGLVTTSDQITGGYFANLAEVVREDGLDPFPLLAELGIHEDLESLRQAPQPAERYLRFVERVLSDCKVWAPALRAGSRLTFADYGILGLALWSSQNLRDALDRLMKYSPVLGDGILVNERYESKGGKVHYQFHCGQPPGVVSDFLIELSAAEHGVVRDMLGGDEDHDFLRVDFPFEAPAHAEALREWFRCELRFGQPLAQVVYPASWLEQPVKTANDLAAKLLSEQCETILQNLERTATYRSRIRRLVLASPANPPSFEDTASQFNLSARTLRRRLSEEGTSYVEVLKEARMELARHYLAETEFAIKEVSALLGFSEVANFQRAFKAWSGVTPSRFRQEGPRRGDAAGVTILG